MRQAVASVRADALRVDRGWSRLVRMRSLPVTAVGIFRLRQVSESMWPGEPRERDRGKHQVEDKALVAVDEKEVEGGSGTAAEQQYRNAQLRNNACVHAWKRDG